MPRVDFYLDADNKYSVAARLAQKGLAAGKRLVIAAPDPETATHIDRLLWTFSPQSFVAHATGNSPLAGESPVLVLQKISTDAALSFEILINLGDAMPETVSGFDRIIEIVTHDDDDKALARTRFKAYRDLGCELVTNRLGPTNDTTA